MPALAQPLGRAPRVFVTRHLLPEVEERLSALFDTTLNTADRPLSREELATAMRDSDVLVPTVTDRIDAELVAAAGPDLRLIASFGAGTDHIDLAAAAARGIIVTNTPGVFTDDTADIAMEMIIGLPRRVREGIALVRRGEWTGWTPTALLGVKLAGKTLGIAGMGRIGQAVAQRARAFGLLGSARHFVAIVAAERVAERCECHLALLAAQQGQHARPHRRVLDVFILSSHVGGAYMAAG